MTANTPRNRAKVKESWPIPQSVGRLPISRLPFSHRANHAATAKHRNVDTNTRTIPSSRGGERISPRNIQLLLRVPFSVSPFRRSCLKIAEAESINSWKISELVRCNWPDKPSIDFLFSFSFFFYFLVAWILTFLPLIVDD